MRDRRQILAGLAAGLATTGAGAPVLAADTVEANPAALPEEPALEPDLPIVDPHHHIRDFAGPPPPGARRYAAKDFLADIARGGHRITKTVFLECGLMYRPDGPPELRSLGETEYARDMAEAIGRADPNGCQVAAGIVAKVDLGLGARAGEILDRHAEAAGGRLKGVRNSIAWDAWPPLAGMGLKKDLLEDPDFLEGLKTLAPRGLVFDTWLFHTQIPSVTALARRVPEVTIVLNHCGNPLGLGPYADRQAEVRADWERSMTALAACPNARVKLGGLGTFLPEPAGPEAHGSARLAARWRPFIEPAIALFGTRRCMFESNHPADAGAAAYGVTWNAFKRITAGASATEKDQLYRGTATETYRL